MADDERRAEIEAVAKALWEKTQRGWETTVPWAHANREARDGYLADARTAIEALDRVRDARGDDEGLPEPQSVKDYKAMVRGAGLRALIPYVHRQTGFATHNCDFEECQIEGCPTLRSLLAARSPQGEDHEAELYVREWLERWRVSVAPTSMVREFIAGFPFPSRVGSVAVEEVERLVEALRDATGHVEHDGLRARMHALVAEFSPASTGGEE